MERWPASLTEVASLIGRSAALAMSAKFGGTRVYIPSCPNRNSFAVRRLVEVIGESAVPALCFAYPGVWLYIPNLANSGIRSVSPGVLALPGSAATIARLYGVSEQAVRIARRSCRATL